MSKPTAEEIEAALCGQTYGSQAEAIAAARAVSRPGDEIEVHEPTCEVDSEHEPRCTCEPYIIVHCGSVASA